MTKAILSANRIAEEKAHATYSASGSERWLNCPGSIALSEKAPEQAESPYALEGTEAHACHEFLLKNRRKLEAATKLAKKKYKEEMVKHGLNSVLWILKRFENAGMDAELLCEQRVDSSSFTMEDQFGTLDAAIVQEFGTLTVIDYKYGAGHVVDPEGIDGQGNPQLVYYALALSERYHHNFCDVELVVIQPRAWHESGETIRTHRMTITELLAWQKVFRRGVQRTKREPENYVPGAWCKFCKAAVICPELKDNAAKEAQIVFGVTGALESVPEPRLVKTPDLGLMLDAAERLEVWIEKLREHALHVLNRGGEVRGYKLVDKRASRKWKDPEKVKEDAFSDFGEEAFDMKLLSPNQLEEKFKDEPKKVKARLEEWVKARTIKESTGLTMVKETDKRIKVDPIAKIFGVIDV